MGMAAARQGARAANGAAEVMIVEAQELDESMRGADGVAGDVQGALCEAVGARPTQCAQWVHCAPNAKWRQTAGMRQGWQVELRWVSGTGQFKNINNDEQKRRPNRTK